MSKNITTLVLLFAELEKQEDPTPESFLATLKDYATGGWAIHPKTVVQVAIRAGLSRAQLTEAIAYAKIGYDIQTTRLEERAAIEYTDVITRIDKLLTSMPKVSA